MTDGLKNLLLNVEEYLKVSETKVEYNRYCNYISVDREGEDEGYFFQDEECENLIKEYENDCLYEYYSLEDYLRYVSNSW